LALLALLAQPENMLRQPIRQASKTAILPS
jgi:hypothetical protein